MSSHALSGVDADEMAETPSWKKWRVVTQFVKNLFVRTEL